ncbi:MAG: UbiA-like polyprenyltransferase [Vulcanibacillus sp.]
MALSKIKIILDMIKFEHTIFALPFAYIGMILGSFDKYNHFPTWDLVIWITVAMVGARSAAMALNRLIDRTIDKLNPRTATRAIPQGKLNIREVIIFVIISLAIFIFATLQLSTLAVMLLPLALFILVIYSYTKRFTWACHYILGGAIGLAPLGAWVAVTNEITFTSIILYLSVAFWTAGFDIIYATQDVDFDKENGLYSIPSRFGIKKSLIIARITHLFTVLGLVYLFFLASLGVWYIIGVIIANFILHYEHSIVSPTDLSKVNTAFFTMNGILSVVIFIFTFLDLLL